MKKQLYLAIVVLALGAFALAQGMGPQGGAAPPPSEVPQASTPGQAGPGPETSNQQKDRDKAQASVSNEQLEKQVHDQLATRPEFSNVTAEVKGSTVVLNGTVASKEERAEAVNMVKGIQGVHKVKDHLKVGAGTSSGSASNNNPANAGVSSGSQAEAPSASGSIAGNTTAASGATAAGSSGATSGTAAASPSATSGTAVAGAAGAGQANEADLNQAIQQANISNVHVITNPQGQVILSGAVPTAADRDKVVQIVQQRAPTAQIINNLVITEQGMPAATTGTGGVSGTAASTTGTGASAAPSATGSVGAQTGAAGTSAGVGAQTGAAGTSGSMGASASPSAGATAGASTGATGMTGASDTNQLQSQIQGAIQNEPTLSGSNVNVNVTDTSIELSGTVPTGKEKQTAKRIAQSYAGNRKVVDRLTVTGRGNGANANPSGAAAGPSSSAPMSEQNPATGATPATTPSANPPSTVPQSQPQTQPQSAPQTTPQPQSDQSVPQTTPHN